MNRSYIAITSGQNDAMLKLMPHTISGFHNWLTYAPSHSLVDTLRMNINNNLKYDDLLGTHTLARCIFTFLVK